MARRSFEWQRADEDKDVEGVEVTAREVISIRTTHDELGVARCPICRDALVARQGRAGPYFFCRCEMKRAS